MHSRIGATVVAFTVIIFTGCSSTPQSNLTPGASLTPSLRSQSVVGRYQHAQPLSTETVLHSFKSGAPHDGANPQADLVLLNGTLYGTTVNGGRTGCEGAGCGTIFSITPSGAETVLYRFKGGTDGGNPNAGLALTNLKGDLYGTTEGTVFKITAAGKEKVLHIFTGYTDGALPEAGLTNVGGTLYGTTMEGGGPHNFGTVFKITRSGTETVLHRFRSETGGIYPQARLTNVDGVLYGTTAWGGAYSAGTVFRITTAGAYRQLYSFGSDGAQSPQAGLTNVNGTLYGTTFYGGASGDGIVFSITTAGAYSQLYSFTGGADGCGPKGDLIRIGKTLYGTTRGGCGFAEDGTIFKITTGGMETPLYSFAGGPDGQWPMAGLTNVNGTLYGTTYYGGGTGYGTVFSFSP